MKSGRTLRLHLGRDAHRQVQSRMPWPHFAGDELEVVNTTSGLVLCLAGGDVRHARLLTTEERVRLVGALLTAEERAQFAAEWALQASPSV